MSLHHGDLHDIDRPDWAPLEDLLGELLASHFMWMCAIGLDDGRVLHAYKHVSTRRYIHATHEGETFLYVGDSSYVAVDAAHAIRLAHDEWEELWPQPDDPRTVRRELAAAIARAAAVGGPGLEPGTSCL